MRVYVEHDMTVNHNTSVVTLRAGQVVEGPLALYLVESDCAVTIEQDDRPSAAPAHPAPEAGAEKTEPTDSTTEQEPAQTETESHVPGSGESATEPAAEPEGAE